MTFPADLPDHLIWEDYDARPMDGSPVLLRLAEPDSQGILYAVGVFHPNLKCGIVGGHFGFDMPRPLCFARLGDSQRNVAQGAHNETRNAPPNA